MGIENAIFSGHAQQSAARTEANASNNAAILQAQAAAEATAEQRRQYDQNRADQAPWMDSGRAALGRLDRTASGDMSAFMASPDYNFNRSEGQRDIGSSFAARGGAASGNALRALSEFNQNLASRQFGDWWNRTASQAGVGQSAVNAVGQFGANAANNIGNINTNAANGIGNNLVGAAGARASGIRNTAAGYQQANTNLANYAGYFFGGGFGG